MGEVLQKIGLDGFRNIKFPGHNNHFHVDLHVPDIVKISGASFLLTSMSPTELTSHSEDENMLSMDMLPVQNLQSESILVAQATVPAGKYEAVLGACKFVEPNDPFDSAINNIPPLSPVGDYFNLRPDEKFSGQSIISVLTQPLHGEIQYRSGAKGGYHYFPNPEYRGKD